MTVLKVLRGPAEASLTSSGSGIEPGSIDLARSLPEPPWDLCLKLDQALLKRQEAATRHAMKARLLRGSLCIHIVRLLFSWIRSATCRGSHNLWETPSRQVTATPELSRGRRCHEVRYTEAPIPYLLPNR